MASNTKFPATLTQIPSQTSRRLDHLRCQNKEQKLTQDDLPAFQTVYPSQPRIIAIGDVHGDLASLVGCLRIARLIDGSENWSGGVTHLVQLGDVVDRGEGERECIDLLCPSRTSSSAHQPACTQPPRGAHGAAPLGSIPCLER
jgi:hypothetical protein